VKKSNLWLCLVHLSTVVLCHYLCILAMCNIYCEFYLWTNRPKHQRRLSVYKIKQKKRPDMEEGPSHLRFSEEAGHILQELFTHYPPDDADLNGGAVRNSSVKAARTRSKDSAFCKPAMRKPDIAKKVEMLTSKVNGSPHLRKVVYSVYNLLFLFFTFVNDSN
jgi:hypothetical protein